uniref:F-box domain-containing protein n=1 Tax=Schizophyllum commune (strain H4-8 / FGSC 9210) TaxID=578458 RepID=D8PVV4_SCHCM
MEFSPKDIDALLDEASVYARVAHLRSGVTPSPQATARIHSVAAELQWILCRRKHLANDSRPTRRIEHALRMCRAAVAPVRRLPRELLIIIFELALPTNWEQAYVTVMPNFASVCHYWREVAIGYGHFWANVAVHQTCPAEAVATRIDWSRNELLNVSLRHGVGCPQGENARWNSSALHALFSQSHRMRRFSVHAAIYYEDIIRAIGPCWPTEFPQLKELDLAVFDNLSDIVEDFIGIAPNVVKLELFCHYVPRSFEVIPAWDLTHLELNLLENGQCLEELIGVIAVYAPTLQSLEVYVLDVGEIDEEYDTIMFPHLRTLKLHYDACYLCRHIVAPQIASIRLERPNPGMSGEDGSELAALLTLLQRSGGPAGVCPLESLELLGMTPAEPQLVLDCFGLAPMLTCLAIQDGDECLNLLEDGDLEKLIISPQLLLAMTRSSEPGDAPQNKLLPRLSSLSLHLEYKDKEVQTLLHDMIASRQAISDSDDVLHGRESNARRAPNDPPPPDCRPTKQTINLPRKRLRAMSSTARSVPIRTAEGGGPQLWTTPLGGTPESTAQRGKPHRPLADLPVTAVTHNPEGKGRPGFWRKIAGLIPLLYIPRLLQLAKATASFLIPDPTSQQCLRLTWSLPWYFCAIRACREDMSAASTIDLIRTALNHANVALIRSGTIPNAQETAQITSLADALQKARDRHHSAAEPFTTTHPDDPIQQELIEHALLMCRAAVAPVRRLPRELLSIIFEMALPDNWLISSAPETLNFASVCFYWREVALGTPKFWSHIVMTLCSHEGPVINRLRLSADEPLDVFIASGRHLYLDVEDEGEGPTISNAEAVQAICSQARRWSSLWVPSIDESMDALAPYWPTEFPALKALKMSCEMDPAKYIRYFDNAPNVVGFSLSANDLTPAPIILPAAWKLVSLDISIVDEERYLEDIMEPIAASAPSLIRLIVKISGVDEMEGFDEPIVFPNLLELKLTDGACFLCNHIVAPSVLVIRLEGPATWNEGGIEMEALLHHLQNTTAASANPLPLKILELVSLNPAPPQVVVDCLELTPNVFRLLINERRPDWHDQPVFADEHEPLVSPGLLAAMTRSPDLASSRDRLLPTLLAVDLRHEDQLVDVEELMRAMLQSRLEYYDRANRIFPLDTKYRCRDDAAAFFDVNFENIGATPMITLPADVEGLLHEASKHANEEMTRSGTIPNPQKTTHILSITDALSKAARDLEVTMPGAKDTHQESAHIPRINRALDVCRAVLAPVRRIPRELLITIFTLALPEWWYSRNIEDQLNFSQVCYYWRAVALGYSEFWTHLAMTISTRTAPVASRLERAGEEPLHVSLFGPMEFLRDEGKPKRDPNPEAIALVFSQHHRFFKLALYDFDKMEDLVAPHWPQEFPALKIVELDVGREHRKCLEYFENVAHNVISFELRMERTFRPVVLPSNWNLVSLELYHIDDETTLDVLLDAIAACAPTLFRLVVSAMELGDVDDERAVVEFPVLHDVTLENAAYYMLQYTTAPLIGALKLEGGMHTMDGSDYIDVLLAFLQRSVVPHPRLKVTRLRTLELEGMPAAPVEQLVACLQLAPALARLAVDEADWRDDDERSVTPELLGALTRSPWTDLGALSHFLLPALTHLKIKCRREADEALTTAMRTMVLSRMTDNPMDFPARLRGLETDIPVAY